MAEQTEPKKRGRKKGSTGIPRSKGKRLSGNLESMSFEQLQELNARITELMKTKKDEQIRILRQKLADLEKI
ncbi:MAG TPA: hypothetical protein VHO46_15515 [Bacteroidales bacterium]|nr:hypothetical protein [Bacteroidales bacterium]